MKAGVIFNGDERVTVDGLVVGRIEVDDEEKPYDREELATEVLAKAGYVVESKWTWGMACMTADVALRRDQKTTTGLWS